MPRDFCSSELGTIPKAGCARKDANAAESNAVENSLQNKRTSDQLWDKGTTPF